MNTQVIFITKHPKRPKRWEDSIKMVKGKGKVIPVL